MENKTTQLNTFRNFIYPVLLVAILIVGASFRLVGLNWDEGTYLHPDERFLLFVENDTSTVDSLSEYFDTDNSTLNPHNVGKDFFVYGTFPIFLVKYVTESLQPVDVRAGLDDYKLVGRQLSAFADLLVVLVVFLIGSRLYDQRVGIVAAFFTAFAVLQIQLSHFFAVDTFVNLFIILALYFAIVIATHKARDNTPEPSKSEKPITEDEALKSQAPFDIWQFMLFGLAVGLAMASKVSAFPIALMLPLAVFIQFFAMDEEQRQAHAGPVVYYLVLAGAVSFFTFRFFQPYTFGGPGFFDLISFNNPMLLNINPKWVANMVELRRFVSGEVDWPPSLQWARRPIWFSFQNLSLWGMGLPMSIMAWVGFLWAGWQVFKQKLNKHLILWVWTAGYFGWQSLAFNPSMRYQLPIYPTLALFAGWALVSLWDWGSKQKELQTKLSKLAQPLVIFVGVVSLVGTFLWAYSFSRIYTVSVARVESSRWIYKNIPGPINMQIETDDGVFNQPVPYSYNFVIIPETPYSTTLFPKVDGELSSILLKHITTPITLSLFDADNLFQPIMVQNQAHEYKRVDNLHEILYKSDDQLLIPGNNYVLRFVLPANINAEDFQELTVFYTRSSDQSQQSLQLAAEKIVGEQNGNSIIEGSFSLTEEGQLTSIFAKFNYVLPRQEINLVIASNSELTSPLVNIQTSIELSLHPGEFSEGQIIEFDKPFAVSAGEPYFMRLTLEAGALPISLLGSAVANETTFDDGLPVRIEGYDGYGGIYQRDLNLQVYWDDAENGVKLDRMLYTLNNSEYLFISSSRQWASTTRIPERYPLVTAYYRDLLGCPAERSVEWCYNRAEVGDYSGILGFELIETFITNPSIGSFSINDQSSEEAFTVYDHPKVFIFQKTNDYDADEVGAILGAVDVSNVIRLTPLEASGKPGSGATLKLSEESWLEQQTQGTWSDLFNLDSLINSNQVVTVIVWYLGLSILGIAVYPLVRMALPGLQDKGYPISKAVGLLLLSYLSWLAGNIGLTYSRLTIGVIYFILLAIGAFLYFRKQEEFKQEFSERSSYFFKIELIIFIFFFVGLVIRLGNPDLWHAAFGGEKPMDFSYFNAVLKSTSFPPYDPWFAGGYINYYYYGFVYVGTLVKLLGIVPAVAYNLIIPTLFSFMGIGAFSVTWNLFAHRKQGDDDQDEDEQSSTVSAWVIGIAGALAFTVLGNLGSLEMIIEGFQELGSFGTYYPEAGLLEKLNWSVRGAFEVFKGVNLPYSTGDWYWKPSRVIPGSAINEFPMFTVIYADLHAHLIALPLTLISLLWAISLVFSNAWSSYIANFLDANNVRARLSSAAKISVSLLIGALAIGALRPTNTWDFPTYLAIAVVAIIYSVAKYYITQSDKKNSNTLWVKVIGFTVFLGLTFTLFKPYTRNYALGYTALSPWNGEITPLDSYFVHWGLFLVIIISWLLWETRQWMASTPLSSLRKLAPYRFLIVMFVFFLFATVAVLQVPFGITPIAEDITIAKWVYGLLSHATPITWFVLPLAAWSGILLLRPKLSDAKRLVLFFIGTALILTLMVDVVIIESVGRMNTVFKFYLQAWTLLSLSSAAALGWLLTEIKLWNIAWRAAWQFLIVILVGSAALFPLLGTAAKMRDRMNEDAPNSLDGMAYMQSAKYGVQDENQEQWIEMELGQDYDAIRWMQRNIEGSPVIVEANRPPYQWGSRFTIYTGLPGVIGWDWHQRQQREFIPGNSTVERVNDIRAFYETEDADSAREFLQFYNVRYIVFGQLEKATYQNVGFDKFEDFDGQLWREVYRDRDTVIYEVIPEILMVE